MAGARLKMLCLRIIKRWWDIAGVDTERNFTKWLAATEEKYIV